jgi:hypothetical protein
MTKPNSVSVRSIKDMTLDEQTTADLETVASLEAAITNGEQYALAVLHGDPDDAGSIEIHGNMSTVNLALTSRMLEFQSVLNGAEDPQAVLAAVIAEKAGGDAA